ncbi:epimerase [Phreatobacter aquaticus]|uniref:Epimerase n=1 Tax=Phreatobacter aquaticus TaxID=2570229 RepID=A0A4D7QS42_9HYPH|nr:epimerase [Phreatobacter aquaticus]QCK87767.1 epimerase [Phreatobacter aquaticus]
MNVLIFGASGMVGQGALRECLGDPSVTAVTIVVRSPTGQSHAKLREVILQDLNAIGTIAADLTGFDACFFTVGVTSVGLSEADYTRLTYDLTLTVAGALAPLNPQMTFLYVTGQGADSSEKGRIMWARVKGRTENALRRLPFKAAYAFRPAAIQPLHGIRSKTGWYQALYSATMPLYPLLLRLFPGYVTTTEQLGKAMIAVARNGYAKPVLESSDINTVV